MLRRLAAMAAALALLVVLPGPAVAKKLSVGETVDLNAATFDDLLRIPGVGKVRARAILEHRSNHGPFGAVDDLDKVKGIGKKSLKKLAPWLRVGGAVSPQDPPAAREEPPKKPGSAKPADLKPAPPKDEGKGPNDVEEL